jgi:hypothetical protein
MSIQWLLWIGKTDRARPTENVRGLESPAKKHEFDIGSDVNNMKC